MSDYSSSSNEDDEEEDPLDRLAAMGFVGADAVDMLMQCSGNVDLAIQQLQSKTKEKAKATTTTVTTKKSKKKKGNNNNANNNNANHLSFQERRKVEIQTKKAKRDSRQVCRVCGGPHPRKECPGVLDDGRGQAKWHDLASKKKQGKERRQLQKQTNAAMELLQLGQWTKNVPYLDGYADLYALFGSLQQQPQPLQPSKEEEEELGTPSTNPTTKTTITASPAEAATAAAFSAFLQEWSQLKAKVGEPLIRPPTREERKQALKQLPARKLRELALAASTSPSSSNTNTNNTNIDNDNDNVQATKVQAAMKHGNPRSELINIILEGTIPEDTDTSENNGTSMRMVGTEWPGYRGCLLPLSILQPIPRLVLEELYKEHCKENDRRQQQRYGIHVLLAVPPRDVSSWMVVGNSDKNNTRTDQEDGYGIPTASSPINIRQVLRSAQEIQDTRVAVQTARDRLLSSNNNKKQKTKAQAELDRLLKRLHSMTLQNADSNDLICTAQNAHLSPVVAEQVQAAISAADTRLEPNDNNNNSHKRPNRVVVGISCGLDYSTTEACHSQVGATIRKAQRDACLMAMQAGIQAGLPLVLECHEAPAAAATAASLPNATTNESLPPSAWDDLIRLLAQHVPESTTLLLRCGLGSKPPPTRLDQLLQIWPNLYIGLSSKLSYSKCDKEFLDLAFDLPLERLILTSETPHALPATFGGGHSTTISATNTTTVSKITTGTMTSAEKQQQDSWCVPPHCACAAMEIAKIKNNTGGPEAVLQTSTANLCRAFGLKVPF